MTEQTKLNIIPVYNKEGDVLYDTTLVHHDRNSFFKIPSIEEMYKARYVGEFTLKAKGGGWVNMPISIFYTKEAHPEGSNYFGMYSNYLGEVMITNGLAAVEDKNGLPVVYTGVQDRATKEILYSAYRHDYQTYNGLMIDGGRDYVKSSIGNDYVCFKIKDGHIHLTDTESNIL